MDVWLLRSLSRCLGHTSVKAAIYVIFSWLAERPGLRQHVQEVVKGPSGAPLATSRLPT